MPSFFIKLSQHRFYISFIFFIAFAYISKAQNLSTSSIQSNSIFGLTIDESSFDEAHLQLNETQQIEHIISELKLIKASNPISKALTVRIVLPIGCESGDDCDPSEKIITNKLDSKYITLMQRIQQENIARIMAELVDSDVASSSACFVGLDETKSVQAYLERAKHMYQKLGAYVDIWEIGNEVNGDWVGGSMAGEAKNKMRRKIVVAQLKAAYDFFETQKQRVIKENAQSKKNEIVPATAITFYFSGIDKNKHSYENTNDEMTSWMLNQGEHYLDKNKNKIAFTNLDYVLVSYYPDDNFYLPTGATVQEPIMLNATDWKNLFASVKDNYSQNTKFGLGEIGAQCYYSKKNSNCEACKTLLLDYDTNEKNPCDKYDAKGELIESRNCPCCQCAQINVMADYYATLHNQISEKMISDVRFKSAEKFIGGYFNWYYSPDVLNKLANGTVADKTQALKVRQAIIDAYIGFK
jgi:hypothetical protein